MPRAEGRPGALTRFSRKIRGRNARTGKPQSTTVGQVIDHASEGIVRGRTKLRFRRSKKRGEMQDKEELMQKYPKTGYWTYGLNKGHKHRDIRTVAKVFGPDIDVLERYVRTKRRALDAFPAMDDSAFETHFLSDFSIKGVKGDDIKEKGEKVRSVDDLERLDKLFTKINAFHAQGIKMSKDPHKYPAPLNEYEEAQLMAGEMLKNALENQGVDSEEYRALRSRLSNLHLAKVWERKSTNTSAREFIDRYENAARESGSVLLKSIDGFRKTVEKGEPRNIKEYEHMPILPAGLMNRQ